MSNEVRVPIQPFDDSFRTEIRKAIARPFEREYAACGADYNPDTVGEAADHVIALLASKLLGFKVTVAPQRIVGNGTLILQKDEP